MARTLFDALKSQIEFSIPVQSSAPSTNGSSDGESLFQIDESINKVILWKWDDSNTIWDGWSLAVMQNTNDPITENIAPEVPNAIYRQSDTEELWISTGNTSSDWTRLRGSIVREHSGDPIGVVAPRDSGEILRDTTNEKLYYASGTTNTDWLELSLDKYIQNETVSSDRTITPSDFGKLLILDNGVTLTIPTESDFTNNFPQGFWVKVFSPILATLDTPSGTETINNLGTLNLNYTGGHLSVNNAGTEWYLTTTANPGNREVVDISSAYNLSNDDFTKHLNITDTYIQINSGDVTLSGWWCSVYFERGGWLNPGSGVYINGFSERVYTQNDGGILQYLGSDEFAFIGSASSQERGLSGTQTLISRDSNKNLKLASGATLNLPDFGLWTGFQAWVSLDSDATLSPQSGTLNGESQDLPLYRNGGWLLENNNEDWIFHGETKQRFSEILTASRDISLSDHGKVLYCQIGITLTIPSSLTLAGFHCTIYAANSNSTLVPASGVNLNETASSITINSSTGGDLYQISTGDWIFV